MGTENSKLATLYRADVYWTATAMQQQGSQFFQHLGAALHSADKANRLKILETWSVECWDFYQRGLELEKVELGKQELQKQTEGGAKLPT